MRLFIILVLLAVTFDAIAQARRNNNEQPPPQIYKDRVKAMLDELVVDDITSGISPLTPEQQEQVRGAFRSNDAFQYDTGKDLQIRNIKIPISLATPSIPTIKLGHTFTTTLIFTDAAGNPWSVDTLTDMSDSEVVSVEKKAPNILTVRPKKRAGKTNLPIKLTGQQRPITFLFDISDRDVFFDVDVQIDALGDHNQSQNLISMTRFQNNQSVPPRLNVDGERSLLLQFMTPEGYTERRLFDERRQPVDPRDFMAWSKSGRLYIMTPHLPYSPDPIEYHASPDGRHRLLEFRERSIIAVRMNTKIFWLHIE